MVKITSACLLGIKCRFDGRSNLNEDIIDLCKNDIIIPVCPEKFGGLPTPRPPSELIKNKVIMKSGRDVTKSFKEGAKEVLRIAQLYGVDEAIFKDGSPACGCGEIYDGTFLNRIIKGDGIATKLLKKNGIKVISEKNILYVRHAALPRA